MINRSMIGREMVLLTFSGAAAQRSFWRPAGAALIVLSLVGNHHVSAALPSPPPAVVVASVVSRNVAPVETYVGHVVAIQQVRIVPRVTAFIDRVPVKQGSDVKAGQILFELQKAQYQDAVASARAQLASAQAALDLADLNLLRAQRLTRQQFESVANLNQAQATRAQDQAEVAATKATLAQAELNLSYCTIASPIAGRIGAVTLTRGNLVTATTPALATVVQLDPIRVVFPVSDQTIVAANAGPGGGFSKGLALSLTLPDGEPYGHGGKVAFLENQVDQQTGTVNVYADFSNPEGLLLPGTFVNVALRQARPKMLSLVPVEAVQTDQQGSYVLVVDDENKVRQQPIELGSQLGQEYIVKRGLRVGERVVVEGVQKVQPGEIVKPTSATPDRVSVAGFSAG
jgi:membrane fusion protein, multidrug efflux system